MWKFVDQCAIVAVGIKHLGYADDEKLHAGTSEATLSFRSIGWFTIGDVGSMASTISSICEGEVIVVQYMMISRWLPW